MLRDLDEYSATPVVEATELIRTTMCNNPTCPCRRDAKQIARLDGQVRAGLLTEEEARRLYRDYLQVQAGLLTKEEATSL